MVEGRKVYGASFHFLGGAVTFASSVPAVATMGSKVGAGVTSPSSSPSSSSTDAAPLVLPAPDEIFAFFRSGFGTVVSERLLAVRFSGALALREKRTSNSYVPPTQTEEVRT